MSSSLYQGQSSQCDLTSDLQARSRSRCICQNDAFDADILYVKVILRPLTSLPGAQVRAFIQAPLLIMTATMPHYMLGQFQTGTCPHRGSASAALRLERSTAVGVHTMRSQTRLLLDILRAVYHTAELSWAGCTNIRALCFPLGKEAPPQCVSAARCELRELLVQLRAQRATRSAVR